MPLDIQMMPTDALAACWSSIRHQSKMQVFFYNIGKSEGKERSEHLSLAVHRLAQFGLLGAAREAGRSCLEPRDELAAVKRQSLVVPISSVLHVSD